MVKMQFINIMDVPKALALYRCKNKFYLNLPHGIYRTFLCLAHLQGLIWLTTMSALELFTVFSNSLCC